MICQRCGQRDATVHLVELVDGKPHSQWLCSVCAGRSAENGEETRGLPFDGSWGQENSGEDSHSLAAFLGQVFEPQDQAAEQEIPACVTCGYTFEQFRKTNRLGCPGCYETFRGHLISILSHLHRHVSHLGKTPGSIDDGADRPGILSRTRVALEKAIAAEDFEKAARLRDEIQRLEVTERPEGDSGG